MAIWQDAQGDLHDDMAGEALLLPSWPQGMTQLTDTQVAAIRAVPVPVPLPAQAQAALGKSDITMLRCQESAVAVPAAWTAYRKALRAIANGTDTASVALPPQPAFPAGT
jgi:hypothetical protein